MVQRSKNPAKGRAAKKSVQPDVTAVGGREPQSTLALPSVVKVLLNGRRKDLEVLTRAGKKSLQGLQVVAKRQTAALKDAVSEWKAVAKIVAATRDRETIGELDQLGRAVMVMALENISEIATLVARTQGEALVEVQQRIGQDLKEVKHMLELP